jgi:peptidoglycan biosynthesis protein MviN/MurJ (putative lipid II flippase)
MLKFYFMARNTQKKPPRPNYAIKLMVVAVALSWVGFQLIFVAGAFHMRNYDDEAIQLGCGGVLLVLYSLFLWRRLKKNDAQPYREQAQLFFLIAAVVLAVLTGLLRWYFYRKMMVIGVIMWGPSCLVTAAYLLMFFLTTRSDVMEYARAPREAWSRRVMHWLKLPARKLKERNEA